MELINGEEYNDDIYRNDWDGFTFTGYFKWW